nr:HAMP domain-containing methyl-accepting chemotaxis protein [Bacillus marinisedimentorum]
MMQKLCSPVINILNQFSFKVKIAGMAIVFLSPILAGAAWFNHPLLWGTALILVVILAYAAVGFYFSILETVGKIETGTKKMASGDLREGFSVHTKDETSQIAISLNSMTDSFSSMIAKNQELSWELTSSFNSFLKEVDDAKSFTGQINEIINQITEGAKFQQVQANESSAAIQQLSAGVQRMADSAGSLAENSITSNRIALDGSSSMEQVVSQMNEIHLSADETRTLLKMLAEHSLKIDTMVKSIFDIASQTNLLALNAQIEAARAGESGLGFAVVAQEVRKLADQSSKAAEEISELIGQIKDDSGSAVSKMEEVHHQVEDGMEKVRQTSRSLAEILHSSERVAAEAQEISAITEEMAAASEEISGSLMQMKEFAAESADDTTTISFLSERQYTRIENIFNAFSHLQSLTEQMDQRIKQFTIKKK